MALTTVWLFFCWPWFVDGNIIPHDAKNHFYPMIRFVAHAWHVGEGFAWSPHHYAGFPMIADPQSAIWTPTLWIPALLSETPSMRLVDTVHLAHLLVGSFAVYFFGRTQEWRWEASLAAALTYMMAGAATFRLEHLLMTVSYMWLAIALWQLNAAIKFGGLWRGILFGVSLAALIVDRNHVAYLGAWFLFAWWVASVFPQLRMQSVGPVIKQHYPVAVGGMLALLLVAIPVVLLLQLAQNSNRPEFSYLDASWQSLHPFSLLTFFLPELYGALDGSVRHWGPASRIWGDENLMMHRGMLHMYSGILPVILICWLGIMKRQLLLPGTRFFVIASVIFLVYSLGRYTPLFGLLYDFAPGVDLFRRPSDGLFLYGFSIALLSGALMNKIGDDNTFKTSLAGMAMVMVGVIFIGYTAFTTAAGYDRLIDFTHSLVLPMLAGGVIILCFLAMNRHAQWRIPATSVLLFVMSADLVYHATGNRMNTRPADGYRVLETTAGNPIFERVAQLAQEKDSFDIGWRGEIVGLGPVVQNLPQIIRSQSVLGYNPLRPASFETYIAPDMQNSAAKKRNFGMAMTGYDSKLTNELGLRYLVSGAPIEALDMGIKPGRFGLIEKISHGRREAHIYENKQALQRVSLLNGTGAINVAHYSNTEIRIGVESVHADTLILRDFYYSGWVASVNGKPVNIERHKKLFRAIKIPKGKSTIMFSFEPLRLSNLWRALIELTE